jgi:diguanylate cyclase (GGDEF)-like protein
MSPEALVACDQARLLFAYAPGSLIISTITSICLVLAVHTASNARLMGVWLGAMLVVLALRALDVTVLHRRRCAGALDGKREIKRFTAGVIATSSLWAAFPVLFFASMSSTGRDVAALVFVAMSGGSVTVLSPSLPAAILSCSAQLMPLGVTFLLMPGREYHYAGALALLMLATMIGHCRTANRSVLSGLRLVRANEALVTVAEHQRQEVEAVNARLNAAQTALHDANHSLERRIVARTADLEREVGERKRYAEALTCLASTDPLTGLCNRTQFAGRLARMLAEAEQAGQECAVLFLDLDNFKQINDVRGHATGDRVLQTVSRLLSQRAGAAAELARWGGDEFVVATRMEAGSEAAASLGADLRGVLATPLHAGLDVVRVDVTVGIAIFPQHGRTQDELIRAADVAMYEAKREGRGRVVLFDHALANSMSERHILEQALRDAADNGQISLAFQPIVSVRTGQCEALEALARWQHPALGEISPAVFIPVAEQSGQIRKIGRFVLMQACREAASWPAAAWSGRAPAVTVNVSVAQVLSGTLMDDVEDALAATGLPASRLQLEITESMFVGDHVRVTPVFESLRRRGIRILLDDFGTGFSSLAYLGKLPIDVIKIDQSFIKAAERDGYAVINAILSIARAMSLEVTAEGVETVMQKTVLSTIGVERLQGFLISRPIAGPGVSPWITQHEQRVSDVHEAVA